MQNETSIFPEEKKSKLKINSAEKKIVELSPFEAVRLRPGMYVGSVIPVEDKILYLEEGKIRQKTKEYSPGFYRLFAEILDNAIDEYKRCEKVGVNASPIRISIDSSTNKVIIEDSGLGFFEAEKPNETSGKTNVETALTSLHAGSNFYNDTIDDPLAGMNGIGSSAVNILSSEFSVRTVNSEVIYSQSWKRFQSEGPQVEKNKKDKTGSRFEFTPDTQVFSTLTWSKDVILSQIILKQFSVNHGKEKNDPSRLKIEFTWNSKPVEINDNIFPEPNFILNNRKSNLIIWESFENSTSFSMINGNICSGIHQKIVQEYLNEAFEYPNAHKFYDCFLALDIPPRFMRFADQNKTRFSGSRGEITPLLEKEIKGQIKKFTQSDIFFSIKEKIEAQIAEQEMKKLKQNKKSARQKISDKYYPPSRKQEKLFLVEGLSAAGGVLQKRNAETDGVYALRGKIKNVRSVSDLSGNREIIDIMNILGLEYNNPKKVKYDMIIIATDADPDGAGHITSLLVNFFAKWFPEVIENKNLFDINLPLAACTINNERKYFFSLEEFEQARLTQKVSNTSYYKGLGSFNINDWKFIFSNLNLNQIVFDTHSQRYLDIAFGLNAKKRKKWLEKT